MYSFYKVVCVKKVVTWLHYPENGLVKPKTPLPRVVTSCVTRLHFSGLEV